MMSRIFLLILFTSFSASAAPPGTSPPNAAPPDAEPSIDAGAVISVLRWDEKSKTFDITLPQYEAQGPNYASLKDLITAIRSAPKTRWERHPELLVGQQFQLDRELKLQPVLATEKLRGTLPAKVNAK